MSTILEIFNFFLKSSGVSIDSRTVEKRNIFFAISGDNFDGHDYVDKALESGAMAAVIDNPTYKNLSELLPKRHLDPPIFCVSDTISTLQQLARMFRDTFQIPVLGITGSNGKTTTKELVAKVIGKKYRVHFTKGNLNNHLGVPLTLLAMPMDTQIAIIEMGANHLGEIADLCKIANPNVGLITNIGKAHIGEFGSFENIVQTKQALFRYVMETANGTILVNAEDVQVNNILTKEPEHVLTYSTQEISRSNSDETITLRFNDKHLRNSLFIQGVTGTYNLESKLYGHYNQINIAAAIACGIYWSVPVKDIADAIEEYIPLNKRSQVLEIGNNTVLLDAYNANPDSMKAAVEEMVLLKSENKVLILGDMLELGIYAEEEHQRLLDWVLQQNFNEIYLVGEEFPLEKGCQYYPDWKSLKQVLNFSKYHQTTFLIKGSRSIALENLVTDFL